MRRSINDEMGIIAQVNLHVKKARYYWDSLDPSTQLRIQELFSGNLLEACEEVERKDIEDLWEREGQ